MGVGDGDGDGVGDAVCGAGFCVATVPAKIKGRTIASDCNKRTCNGLSHQKSDGGVQSSI